MPISTISAAARTDRGQRRADNQDAILSRIWPERTMGLFAVADGMGGQRGGEIASALAIDTLRTELLPLFAPAESDDAAASGSGNGLNDVPLTGRLHDAVTSCNRRVLAYAEEHPEVYGMGSTLALVLITGSLAVLANIGDSRIYRVREGAIERLTHDHSYVAQLAALGKIEPEDVYTHPQRNYIYRALGSETDAQPDIFTERLQSGDMLLICSDGLWGMVRDDAILRIVDGAKGPDETATQLVALANKNGGDDNISIIVVQAT